MDLAEYYEEVTKTAGLIQVDTSEDEEKVAAIVAVAEQFDIDGIAFEDEDEKLAAAVAIVEGFEEGMEKEARKGVSGVIQRARIALKKAKRKVTDSDTYKKTRAHLSAHKGKYALGVGAAGGAAGGFYAGRKTA